MESSMFFGNACHNGLMPALVRPALPSVQTSLAMKQFLPFPLDAASAVSLFPGFNTMDPVQKAVLHHTLGLPPTAKRKHVSCSVCQLRFNSQSQALAHYKGTKHAKKLKALDTPKSKLKGSAVTRETANQDVAKGLSTSQIPDGTDRKGTKHKTMLEARSGVGSIKSFPRPGVKSKLAACCKSSTGLQNKTFYCETCDVHVNSETQLKQHISSRRHKDRAAGKPAKPKYSPYSKPQKGPSKQPMKLALGKERQCQPLATQIIPAHLAAVAAAAAAISSSFTHRSSHATAAAPAAGLFPTQTLPTGLLRPAPGPVRTSHPPVLFAPY